MRQVNSLSEEMAAAGRAGTPRVPTLLLLEVDQLPSDAQAELAGFLALPGFEMDAIATAQEPLLALAERGGFRADLAYALSTLVIDMPALVERAGRHSAAVPVFCREVQCRGWPPAERIHVRSARPAVRIRLAGERR